MSSKKGLIVIGYQGIGKSSISGIENGVIDLESSNFKYPDGSRLSEWHELYCQIAVNLAKQGFIVCISSHKCVCDELSKYDPEDLYDIVVICPTINLKEQWLKRLSNRLGHNPVEKNWLAYINAKENYENSIKSLSNTVFDNIYVSNVSYDLKKIIDIYKDLIND